MKMWEYRWWDDSGTDSLDVLGRQGWEAVVGMTVTKAGPLGQEWVLQVLLKRELPQEMDAKMSVDLLPHKSRR